MIKLNKQNDETNKLLTKGISELQLAVNNCSNSINKFIDAFEKREPGDMGIEEYNLKFLTSHSFIQALESLQEIRKIIMKKKKLHYLYKDNFETLNVDQEKWVELKKEIINEIQNNSKYLDYLRIVELSSVSSNYDSLSIKSTPQQIEITKIPPLPPWIAKDVFKK